MKNSPSKFIPVILFAGIFIFSCNAANREPESARDEVSKSNRYAPQADPSANGGFEKVPYEAQETGPGKVFADGENKNIALRDATEQVGNNAFSVDQTEISNPGYQ